MSFLYFGNTPASVPPILDTSPCMKEMLTYEDCVFEYFDCNVVRTYPKCKSCIPTGPQCGQDCWLTGGWSTWSPRTWCSSCLMITHTWDRWQRRTDNFCGNARRKDSCSKRAWENCHRYTEPRSTQVGTQHQFPTCTFHDGFKSIKMANLRFERIFEDWIRNKILKQKCISLTEKLSPAHTPTIHLSKASKNICQIMRSSTKFERLTEIKSCPF
jgi:hypothetical protein